MTTTPTKRLADLRRIAERLLKEADGLSAEQRAELFSDDVAAITHPDLYVAEKEYRHAVWYAQQGNFGVTCHYEYTEQDLLDYYAARRQRQADADIAVDEAETARDALLAITGMTHSQWEAYYDGLPLWEAMKPVMKPVADAKTKVTKPIRRRSQMIAELGRRQTRGEDIRPLQEQL